jgi:hypothetical protein
MMELKMEVEWRVGALEEVVGIQHPAESTLLPVSSRFAWRVGEN